MKKLIEHLRGLGNRDIDPVGQSWGVCDEIDEFADYLTCDRCKDIMRDWPKRVDYGDGGFFVPHPFLSPYTAFMHTDDLWEDSEYGDNRRELCLWLAEQLEATNES